LKGRNLIGILLLATFILGLVTQMVVVIGGAEVLPKLFVNPQTYVAMQLGEVFTIDINVANITGLTSFEFKLGYNTTLLDVLDVIEGSLPEPPVGFLVKEVNDSEGYVWVSVSCGLTEGNGTLATITFTATSAQPASSTLHLYDTLLLNALSDPIPHQVQDGQYQFSILKLNVETDRLFYWSGENITIHGNLTLDDACKPALVGLEVDNFYDFPLVIRTLQTGPVPEPEEITITDLFPCNQWGAPQSSFAVGETAYFNVFIRNNSSQPKNVTITINAFDSSMSPLFPISWCIIPLAPKSEANFIGNVPIPNSASSGNGTVYANVFTDWPKCGGLPYCHEKNATFQITGGKERPRVSSPSPLAGNYSVTFRLPVDAVPGIYRVYVTSIYQGRTITNNTAFDVRLWGDVNLNGRVDLGDIGKVILVYSGIITGPTSSPAAT